MSKEELCEDTGWKPVLRGAVRRGVGSVSHVLALVLAVSVVGGTASAAGLLKPAGAADAAGVGIKSHAVNVVINNGFSATAVDQIFVNGTGNDMEAIYTFPLPRSASMSEVSLWIDGQEVIGEVVEKERARQIYEEQVVQGRETALAEKNDFKTFDVHVGLVRANAETRVRILYYQPLEIDLNVGRYVYPLAEGGVDEERIAFWSVDDRVSGTFSFELELKSAFPVKDVRVPGYEQDARVERIDGGGEEEDTGRMPVPRGAEGGGDLYRVRLDQAEGAALSRDVVVYYRLDDSVPARVELVPYRSGPDATGTLMAVITPAASLQRLGDGTDWLFVLDVSGSMSGGKIATLADGVTRVLGKMSPEDRFAIVTFNNNARDLTRGYVQATPQNVESWTGKVKRITAKGGTALFAGLERGYRLLDADRTTGMILVTDGVCNVGPTQHADFLKLMRKQDVRLFTFVIGNSANRPLLERLATDSGGFAMNISDADDIVGRLLQAKAKVLHECLHDVKVSFRGEKVFDLTPEKMGNIYVGEQVVLFGRYRGSGELDMEFSARVAGEARTWHCRIDLPETDIANPELERLWALSATEEAMRMIREKGDSEALVQAVVELGKEFSLVTDYTSMVVVREETFEEQGIERRNVQRVQRERQARAQRAAAPARSHRVDQGQTFNNAPAPGLGTGPVGPLFLLLAGWMNRRRKRNGQ